MSASLVYLLIRQILQMLIQLARDGGAKDVELVGLVKPVRLRCLRVFVDQSAEDRLSLDSGGVEVDDLQRRVRRSLVE